jgi:hypothetical protein
MKTSIRDNACLVIITAKTVSQQMLVLALENVLLVNQLNNVFTDNLATNTRRDVALRTLSVNQLPENSNNQELQIVFHVMKITILMVLSVKRIVHAQHSQMRPPTPVMTVTTPANVVMELKRINVRNATMEITCTKEPVNNYAQMEHILPMKLLVINAMEIA